jgi:putative membrane protein
VPADRIGGVAVVAIVCGALLSAYLVAARRHGSRRHAWPAWQCVAFAAGMVVLAVGLAPVWGRSFSGHVGAHLLLGMLAPLLLVLGDPLGLALARVHPRLRRQLLGALNHPVARTLTLPAVAWVLAIVTPWLLWLTPLYRMTVRVPVLHGLVHLHFIAAGFLFASVVLGAGPLGRRVPPTAGLLLLGLALPAHALLGLVLLTMNHPVATPTGSLAAAMADQHRGAMIMWLAGDGIATIMIAASFPRWLQAERRRAQREDAVVLASLRPSTEGH